MVERRKRRNVYFVYKNICTHRNLCGRVWIGARSVTVKHRAPFAFHLCDDLAVAETEQRRYAKSLRMNVRAFWGFHHEPNVCVCVCVRSSMRWNTVTIQPEGSSVAVLGACKRQKENWIIMNAEYEKWNQKRVNVSRLPSKCKNQAGMLTNAIYSVFSLLTRQELILSAYN